MSMPVHTCFADMASDLVYPPTGRPSANSKLKDWHLFTIKDKQWLRSRWMRVDRREAAKKLVKLGGGLYCGLVKVQGGIP